MFVRLMLKPKQAEGSFWGVGTWGLGSIVSTVCTTCMRELPITRASRGPKIDPNIA